MASTDSNGEKKKAIFDAMSPRRQRYILKKVGYERWNPFEKPKAPIDIRTDKTKRTAQMLVSEFLRSRSTQRHSSSYRRGVLEMAIGIINDDDRFLAMYEFALWHKRLLKEEGHE